MTEGKKHNRQFYMDNLRNIDILLLFPGHAFMIWNTFEIAVGSNIVTKFYIWSEGNTVLSTLIVAFFPWFMPILFVIAGMSARYALEKRTKKQFIKQRVEKLLIPFITGLVLLVPFQTLFARKFFQDYQGGILSNIKYFFTHLTDFIGYDGAFTPGHLWFILFLFIISMVGLIFFHFLPYEKFGDKVEKIPLWGLCLFFIPIWIMHYVGDFSGYSLGKNLMLYLLGYYVMSNDKVIEKLEKNIIPLGVLYVILTGVSIYRFCKYSNYDNLWFNIVGWISILFILAFAKKFMNKETAFTRYYNKASYPIYILHQSILIGLAYYVLKATDVFAIQLITIILGSFLLTEALYHILSYIPFVRRLFGIDPGKK